MKQDPNTFLTEVLDEIKDTYIEEAVQYKPAKKHFVFRREFSAVAACIAVVLLAGAAYYTLPFRNDNSTSGEMAPEQEAGPEEAAVSGEASQNVLTEEAVEEDADVYSVEVAWELIRSEEAKEKTADMTEIALSGNGASGSGAADGAGTEGEAYVAYACGSFDAEEVLQEAWAEGRDAFYGTVVRKELYEVTGGVQVTAAVITVEITRPVQGETAAGDICRILLPVSGGYDIDTMLPAGTETFFIPAESTVEDGIRGDEGDAFLCYADLAEYYMLEDAQLYTQTN